jgi:NTP pyrophosphatase (non-canonical NTP hydrolase)
MNHKKGFNHIEGYEPPYDIPVYLGLIGSEVTEALISQRDGWNMNELGKELADIIIRTLHLARLCNFNIGLIVKNKIEKNKDRPFRHGHELF